MSCRLCHQQTIPFHASKKRRFEICTACDSVQVEMEFLPDDQTEINRYRLHNNDLNDPGYRDFLKPLVQAVKSNHTPEEKGLDFGSGPEPVLVEWLLQEGYKIAGYDPFFAPDAASLTQQYHYIICCEVMEHFHNPDRSFKQLAGLLMEGGRLYCKTQLLNSDVVFNTWWYKNDETHVFFYTPKALDFLKDKFGFSGMEVNEDFIVLTK